MALKNIVGILLLTGCVGCATVESPQKGVEAPVSRAEQIEAQKAAQQPEEKILKRKIGIGRFTNESRYGRSLVRDGDLDPLGKQVSDMLMSRLVQSGRFIVLERTDLGKIEREQAIIAGGSGRKSGVISVEREGTEDNFTGKVELESKRFEDFALVGVDTLIIGSLTEFSRKNIGKSGFLSGTKKQIAEAKVEVRLVDPLTGHAFFSASGAGTADSESGRVAGFGSKASYDDSLNDKAIAAAISDLIGDLITNLESRPWRASILKIDGENVFISGGKYQGLETGDRLRIMAESGTVRSGTGFDVRLPPTEKAVVEVLSFFGESETNEGSVVRVVSGALPAQGNAELFVSE